MNPLDKAREIIKEFMKEHAPASNNYILPHFKEPMLAEALKPLIKEDVDYECSHEWGVSGMGESCNCKKCNRCITFAELRSIEEQFRERGDK